MLHGKKEKASFTSEHWKSWICSAVRLYFLHCLSKILNLKVCHLGYWQQFSVFQLALYVLSFLGPKDLLQAAQTCRYWRVLTEDNLLWREKCKEESIDESLVFGTNRLRRRQPSPKSPWKSLYMRQHQIEQNWRSGPIRTPKVHITQII